MILINRPANDRIRPSLRNLTDFIVTIFFYDIRNYVSIKEFAFKVSKNLSRTDEKNCLSYARGKNRKNLPP